jgi:glycosyltransferase involved in cell wall biosynthesis
MEYRKVSIVIPIYNEQATIEQVLDLVKKVSVLGLEKEIILVDDFSTDGTREILEKIHEPNIKVIFLPENQGKGAALHSGFIAATGDIALIQDADLEYDPHEIEKVLRPFFEYNAQVVYGSRYLEPTTGLNFLHTQFNKLFTNVGNILMSQRITDIMTCYKAFSREVVDKVFDKVFPTLESKRFGFEPEVTAKVTKLKYKIFEVPISYKPRNHHQGKHMNFRGQIDSLLALIKYSL